MALMSTFLLINILYSFPQVTFLQSPQTWSSSTADTTKKVFTKLFSAATVSLPMTFSTNMDESTNASVLTTTFFATTVSTTGTGSTKFFSSAESTTEIVTTTKEPMTEESERTTESATESEQTMEPTMERERTTESAKESEQTMEPTTERHERSTESKMESESTSKPLPTTVEFKITWPVYVLLSCLGVACFTLLLMSLCLLIIGLKMLKKVKQKRRELETKKAKREVIV